MTQKQRNTANHQPQEVQAAPAPKKSDGVSWLSVLVSVFTVLTSILLVLGYGYKRGVADVFHLEVSEIADSASDFLIVAADALAYVLMNMLDKFSIFIKSIWIKYLIESVVLAVMFPLGWYLAQKRNSQQKPDKDSSNKKDAWYKRSIVQYLMASFFGLGVYPITLLVLYILILYVLAMPFAFLIPLGYAPGKENAETYIIKPQHCAPLPFLQADTKTRKPQAKQDKQTKEVFANCVAVVKDGNEIARGRRIAVHAERIFLYIKKTGEVKSVPLNDATIVLVDSE